MRLTHYELNAIKQTFLDLFHEGKIYLFGSRVDDTKIGGDIDLYLELRENLNAEELMRLKVQFKLKLYDLIGEQKIDIVVSKDKDRSIEKEIMKNGVLL